MNTNLKNNFDTIDLFKFIGSIMIFAMHATALNDLGGKWSFAWELLTRWAVPFFFISSSFFLFLNGKDNIINAGKKYIKRICLLYCSWFIINIPSTFIIRLFHENLFSITTWLVFFKNSILSSSFTGSWFLVSCIFSCIFVIYFCRNLSTKVVLLLTGIMQLLCIFTSAWGGVLPPTTRIGVFLSFSCFPLNITGGCFYFAIGRLLAENNEKIRSFTIRKSVMLVIISCALYATEILIAKKCSAFVSTDQSFFVIPFGIFAFITAYNSKLSLKGKSKKLRKASTIIFCAQSNLFIIKRIIGKYIYNSFPSFEYANTVSVGVIFILMFFVVFIVLKMQSKKIKFSTHLT